jgi:D-alanyl-D-alanine carboxypeptidase
MTSGDCLVTAREDGRFDVFKVATNGRPQPIRRDISDAMMAWLIAQTKVGPNGHEVYFKYQSEPDSAIRLYRPS